MKRSTLIMIALTLAALLVSITAALVMAMNSNRVYNLAMNDKERVQIPLAPFGRVEVVTTGSHVYFRNYKGVIIEESDSVDTPRIDTYADWAKALRPEIVDSVLRLQFDYNQLLDSVSKKHGSLVYLNFEVEDPKPVKVTVPRGMVKSASTDQYNIYLHGFKGGNFRVKSVRSYGPQYKWVNRGWVMVNDGWIDTLDVERPTAAVRLENARVADLYFPLEAEGDPWVGVVTKRPSDLFERIHLVTFGNHTTATFGVEGHVGTLILPPDTANVEVALTLREPIEIKYEQ